MDGGDLVASVSVEGRRSLVNVDCFSDLSWEPLLPHHHLGVLQCVVMISGRGVFRDGRVDVFSICVLGIRCPAFWRYHQCIPGHIHYT